MQASLIIDLYYKYKSNGIKISTELMNKLLSLDSKLIKFIINNNIDANMLERYLNNYMFNNLDVNTQILVLENDNDYFFEFEDFLDRINDTYLPKILKIMYNCKNKEIIKTGFQFFLLNKPSFNSEVEISAFKNILESNTLEHAKAACCYMQDEGIMITNHTIEVTKIIATAKTKDHAKYAYKVSRYYLHKSSDNVEELIRIVANAKTKKNAEYACKITQSDKVSRFIIELTELFANTNEAYLEFLYKMIDDGFVYIVIDLLYVFKSRINTNNFDAIMGLLLTNDCEKSNNPIRSLEKILKSSNDYKPFEVVYKESSEDAIKGVEELNKEFPGIDIKPSTFVKSLKHKKETKLNNE